jgi:AcrR family transcriptional regulator
MPVKNSAKTRKGKASKAPKRAAGDNDSGNRRERILEAATEEFAAKGLAGARVHEIAAKSKCNKQLIYYYFESKQGLYDAVLRQLIELTHQLQEEREENQETVVPWQPGGVDGDYTPLWRRFWMWEALETGRQRIPLEKERRAVFKRLAGLVAEAQERGEVDEELDPEMFFMAMSAILEYPHIFPQLAKFYAGESPNAAKFEKRHQAFIEQLLKRLAPQ